MPLKDDKDLTELSEEYELLLEGEGIITNMDGPNINLYFRYDSDVPDANDKSRIIFGRSENKDSFVNTQSDSKIYGRAESGTVKVLVTRMV